MVDQLSPENVFRLHPKIRWAAFSTESGQVAFCQMRSGVKSYTSDADDRAFMELGPLLLTGVAERLTPTSSAGKVQSVIVNMEKDSVMLLKVRNGFLAISVDRNGALATYEEIEKLIPQLG